MKKICTKCLKNRDLEDFCLVRKNKDGRNTRCRSCCGIQSSEWKRNNKERVRKSHKKWRIENRDRVLQLKKDYRDRDPERSRKIVRKSLNKNKEKYKPQKWRRALMRLYGLQESDFYILQSSQNNTCAICGRKEADSLRQKLLIDHCHASKSVRGLLCFSCNVILGNAKDNPDVLRKAAEYLENPPAQTLLYRKED